jgi:hypothetical protein
VQLATLPRLKREGLLERDDPIGEIARIVAALRQEPSTMAKWDAITELAEKLPHEVMGGADPISLDPPALREAITEAEELLLAQFSEGL